MSFVSLQLFTSLFMMSAQQAILFTKDDFIGKQKRQQIYISYKSYKQDKDKIGIFDYSLPDNDQYFKKGTYLIEIQKQLYFYKQSNQAVSISKTPKYKKDSSAVLLFWLKIDECEIQNKLYIRLSFKNVSDLKKKIEQQQKLRQRKQMQNQSYFYGQKYKKQVNKLDNRDMLQYQSKVLNKDFQQMLPSMPTNQDYDICFVVSSFKNYYLKQGSTIKFAIANKITEQYNINHKNIYHLQYLIKQISFINGLQETDSKHIKNNPFLNPINQQFFIYIQQRATIRKQLTCPVCFREQNQQIGSTILDVCACKNGNNYCLQCLCKWTQQQIKDKGSGNFGNYNHENMLQKKKEPIQCKNCKKATPQYVLIQQKMEDGLFKNHYFKIITKKKQSQLILKNQYFDVTITKKLNQGEMQIGLTFGCWLYLQSNFVEKIHASLFFDEKQKTLEIKDHKTRYGTFVVQKQPQILLQKNKPKTSRSIQIANTVISFELKTDHK